MVATPGRLADLASSNLAPRLNDASILILDEADRMLQLGFEEQLDAVAATVPGKRQTPRNCSLHGDVPGQAAGRGGALGAIVDRDGARQRVEGRRGARGFF